MSRDDLRVQAELQPLAPEEAPEPDRLFVLRLTFKQMLALRTLVGASMKIARVYNDDATLAASNQLDMAMIQAYKDEDGAPRRH